MAGTETHQNLPTTHTLLTLNTTSFLFIPALNGASETDNVHKVVQVTLTTPKDTKKRAEAVLSFFLAQHEVSEVIMRTVTMHETTALPTQAIRFTNPTYTLLAERKAWTHGRTLRLSWGDEPVHASADKWTFVFQPI